MKVLITAGPVYGKLDDNKLLSNRVRGIWACKFAGCLSSKGHDVILLVPNTMPKLRGIDDMVGDWAGRGPCCATAEAAERWNREGGRRRAITVLRQDGFEDYCGKCWGLACKVDAAVMAAAVVNWIPAEPFTGKMPTEGYVAGDTINIKLKLAENVIGGMKAASYGRGLTLIGCKMLSGATEEQLLDTAYEKVLLKARCNVVIANDMQLGLRTKHLVYKDRSVQTFDDDFDGFFKALLDVIEDKHYRTETVEAGESWKDGIPDVGKAALIFDRIVAKYRDRFIHPVAGSDRVYGSLVVPIDDGTWLCSPREKGEMFSAKDAVIVKHIRDGVITVIGNEKKRATLNAPLLIRAAQHHNRPVLHLHEELPDVPTVPYAPPGTCRDNDRVIPGDAFNIKGHGFVKILTDPENWA